MQHTWRSYGAVGGKCQGPADHNLHLETRNTFSKDETVAPAGAEHSPLYMAIEASRT